MTQGRSDLKSDKSSPTLFSSSVTWSNVAGCCAWGPETQTTGRDGVKGGEGEGAVNEESPSVAGDQGLEWSRTRPGWGEGERPGKARGTARKVDSGQDGRIERTETCRARLREQEEGRDRKQKGGQ